MLAAYEYKSEGKVVPVLN